MEDRAAFIERFVNDSDRAKAELGLLMLDAALEAWHFSSSNEFDFGARKRDFGYQPETRVEVERWYGTFLSICVQLCLSNKPIADRARKVLADNLRGLWTRTGILDALEEAVRKVHADRSWNEGWLALRGIMRFDSKGFPEEIRNRLHRLEADLRPNELLDQARTFALTDHHSAFDLDDDYDDEKDDASSGWRKAMETTRELGRKVAQNSEALDILLPDLVSKHTQRLGVFGEGLAAGCADRSELWSKLRSALEKTAPELRQIAVLYGFLAECSRTDPSFYQSTLDDLVEDDLLGPWFPYLQTSANLDDRAVMRLHRALDAGIAHINTFQYLAYGRAHEPVADGDLARLIEKILSKDGGSAVATEILTMRFHGKEGLPSRQSEPLRGAARAALLSVAYPREGRGRNNGHDLARLVEVGLEGPEAEDCARQICNTLAAAIQSSAVYAFDYPDLLTSIASKQPGVFLDTFLDHQAEDDYRLQRIFIADLDRHGNPLNLIPDQGLLAWCDIAPERRYPLVAGAIQPFTVSEEKGALAWKPVIYAIFERAPVLSSVLEELADCVRPRGGWSGSLADILEKRVVLFETLFGHENDEVAAWARQRYAATREWIAHERENEGRRTRDVFESFE